MTQTTDFPTPEQEAGMLADAAEVDRQSPTYAAILNLTCHVKALLARVSELRTTRDLLIRDSCDDFGYVAKVARAAGVPQSEIDGGGYHPGIGGLCEVIEKKIAELRAENNQYRCWIGCPSCGEDHPAGSMCPPHEVRTTGQAWWNEAAARLQAENVQVRRDKANEPAHSIEDIMGCAMGEGL